jgi:hydrogenase 3 maturation protease
LQKRNYTYYQRITQTIPKDIFRGKVVIVGIGNTLRGDDGLGPALIERLKGNIGAVCLDVGNAPENYAGKIVKEKPDTILIIDALHLGKRPGEYEILVKGDISRRGLTTHDISPTMFLEYLEQETGADILVLGIQPGRLKMGDGLSEPVKQALRQIEERLIECMS